MSGRKGQQKSFRSGAAPRIIVSGVGDAEANKRFLVSKGVPASAIQTECESRSTRENALFTVPLLRALPVGRSGGEAVGQSGGEAVGRSGGGRNKRKLRVIIVTSWYHSRRALHAFEHYGPDIQFYSRPSYHGLPRAEWSHNGINGYIRSEYVKLAGYWVCYGVGPF